MDAERSIFIYGPIGYDKNDSAAHEAALTSHSIMESMLRMTVKGHEAIDLYLNSLAGELEDVLELIAFISILPAKVNCHALGSVANAATWLLFSATGTRVVSRFTSIHYSDIIEASAYLSVSELETYAKARKEQRAKLMDLIARRSGIDPGRLERELFSKRKAYLTPGEAKELGLVDVVI